jgi:ferritin
MYQLTRDRMLQKMKSGSATESVLLTINGDPALQGELSGTRQRHQRRLSSYHHDDGDHFQPRMLSRDAKVALATTPNAFGAPRNYRNLPQQEIAALIVAVSCAKTKENPAERSPMLTSQKVIDAINEQIGYEFSAELQYYAIAAHFAAEALPQLSAHFFRQAEEEKGHALRFIKYVVDAGGRVQIPAINAPKSKFKTARDAVKLSLDQEIHVTNQINGLVELARKENDYITINFLQWFLTEQLEEVSSMDNLLKIIERAGTDLLQADEYLARVGLRTMPEPPKQ